MHWNAMRICVGLVPDFWYDIADEHGLLLQNEWNYWQNRLSGELPVLNLPIDKPRPQIQTYLGSWHPFRM